MTQRANTDIMAEYCQRMISGDFTALSDLVSPDWISHANPTVILPQNYTIKRAIDGERQFFSQVCQAFSQRQLVLNKNMAIEPDHVVINYTITGIHDGSKFYNVVPTGKPERIEGTAILRFADGKIAEHWGGPSCETCTGYVTLAPFDS